MVEVGVLVLSTDIPRVPGAVRPKVGHITIRPQWELRVP